MRPLRVSQLAGVVAIVLVAACGGSDSTGSSSSDTMTASEADNVGNTVSTLIDGAAASLTSFSIDDGTLTDPDLSPGTAPRGRSIFLSALRAGARMGRGLNPPLQAD